MNPWKILTFAALLLTLTGSPAWAQNPIPNPGFESWTNGQPDGWMTSEDSAPGSITETSDAYSGGSAVRGSVVEVFPGFLAQPMIQTGEMGEGFLTNTRWGSLDGFYRFNAVGGDQLLISALMFKGDSAIGGSSIFLPSNSAYQSFSVPIFYFTGQNPDTCIVYAFIVGSTGALHLGSYFQFDDLSMGTGAPPQCNVALTGDVNNTGDRVTSDIIYLVNFVLKGGPAPLPCAGVGDVNCDGNVATSDIIYMVNFVLKGGAAPCDVCSIIPGSWNCP